MDENMSVATQPLAPQPEAAVRMIEPILPERPVEDTQALVARAQIVEREYQSDLFRPRSRVVSSLSSNRRPLRHSGHLRVPRRQGSGPWPDDDRRPQK